LNGYWSSKENSEAIKVLDNPLWKSLPAVKSVRSGSNALAVRRHEGEHDENGRSDEMVGQG